MNYQKFKQMIELINIMDEKHYNQLVQQYGKETIDTLFERYLNDSDIVDDDKKFNHTIYYIEQMSQEESKDEKLFKRLETTLLSDKEYNRLFPANGHAADAIVLYLRELAIYPLLELDQEKELMSKLLELKNKKEEFKIFDKDLDEELVAIGYKGTISKKYYVRKKQSKYIENILMQLESKRESLMDKQITVVAFDEKSENLIKEIDERISDLKNLKYKIDIQKDYQETYELLVNSNLRLVVSVAKRYIRSDVPLLDLIQEGNKGLMKAIEKFDATKGCKLSTYAIWWIRQAITRSIPNQSRLIRIPVYLAEQTNKVVNIKKALTVEFGRQPTCEEIAKQLNDKKINKKRIENILAYQETGDPISLSEPISEDDTFTLEELIIDETSNVEDSIFQSSLRNELEEMLATLTEREEKILRLRFGFDDGKCRTLEEIGQVFDVTRERIRQIEDRALRKLRKKKIQL